jgi:hypothetical protein
MLRSSSYRSVKIDSFTHRRPLLFLCCAPGAADATPHEEVATDRVADIIGSLG